MYISHGSTPLTSSGTVSELAHGLLFGNTDGLLAHWHILHLYITHKQAPSHTHNAWICTSVFMHNTTIVTSCGQPATHCLYATNNSTFTSHTYSRSATLQNNGWTWNSLHNESELWLSTLNIYLISRSKAWLENLSPECSLTSYTQESSLHTHSCGGDWCYASVDHQVNATPWVLPSARLSGVLSDGW